MRSILLLLLLNPLFGLHAQQMTPEFTGLQPLDASRYVNPVTGDFNFQTLLLEIPGSQGSYPLMLNYQAGIGLNQPASWVGLGFNLEPGAIYRSISQVPDDYQRNKITVKEFDPGVDYREDIRNSIEDLVYRIGTANAKIGKNFNTNWHSKGSSYLFKDFDELGIASFNFVSAINLPSVYLDPIGFIVNSVMLFTTFPMVGSSNISSWDYTVLDEVEKKKFLFLTTDKDKVFKAWLDKTNDQNAYGFLYEHQKVKYRADDNRYFVPPTFADGSVPELYSYNNPQIYDENRSYDSANITSDYFQLADTSRFEDLSPVFSAPDAYIVSSPLLSGELTPLRYDNVSLSSSNISNRYHGDRIATYTYALPTTDRSQRPQFVFNEPSNQFSFFSEEIQQGTQGLQYDIKAFPDDPNAKLLNFPVQASSLTADAPAREGYDGAGILKQAVQVDWFTNQEINDGLAYDQGFIDFKADRSRGFQDIVDDATSSPFPPHGIGGFTATDKNGIRYHFALPVYERSMKHYSEFYLDESETTYESTTTYDYPYAKKWLLTAITGPDFVDNGSQPGVVDNLDHGYHIRFDYGKYSSDSYWRSPQGGVVQVPDNETFRSHSSGIEQQYFLNSITTATHTALFVKKRQRDFLSDADGNKGHLLALQEIILLSNEDYRQLRDLKGGTWDLVQSYNKDFSKNVIKHEDIYNHSDVTSLIESATLRRVVFDHNYSLCQQAPTQTGGKLTLRGIDLFGKGNTPVMEGFTFRYESNPNYHPLSYDAWGLYKNNQVEGQEAHLVTNPTEGKAWSLTRIKTPNQQQIDINYGRDQYERVAQYVLGEARDGGNLRVDAIESKDLISGIRHSYTFDYRTGVTSSEPAFSLGEDYDLLSVYRYPRSQVTYQEVEKKKEAGGDFLYKEVSTFGVMDAATIQLDTLLVDRHVEISPDDSVDLRPFTIRKYYYGQELNQAVYQVQYRTDLIGQLQHQATYGASDQLLQETTFHYEDSPLGHFSQAAHLLDHTYRNYTLMPTESNQFDARMTYRFINTVSSYIPQRLASVSTTDHTTNIAARSRFMDYDFYTGEPLKTVTDDANGNRMVQEKVPAFRKISAMGLAEDGGTNQLSVPAATYAYYMDNALALDSLDDDDLEPTALIGAAAQQWDPYGKTVWRPQQGYRWIGEQALEANGTHSYDHFASQSFTWQNATQPAGWEAQGKTLAYNPNGISLLSEDISGQTMATLVDPEEKRVIASSAYARPNELAFSGAEYYARFGETEGRVAKGGGTPTEARAHTGVYSLQLPSGSEGFSVSVQKSQGADLNRRYRASVWVYLPGTAETQADMDNVTLFYSVDGTERGSVHPILQASKSKSWYQLSLDINPPAGANQITVACRNQAGRDIYLDDLRVHPLEASMTSYVYDPVSEEITHVLNADNFYRHYEYDELGNLITTQEEFFYPVDRVVNRTQIHYATPN